MPFIMSKPTTTALPSISSRHWRVRVAAAPDVWFDIAELELASSIGGANICTGGPVITNVGLFTNASNMIDGNSATYGEYHSFTSLQNSGPTIDLLTSQVVKEVRIRVGNTFTTRGPYAVFVDTYDGSSVYTPRFYGINTTAYTANGLKTFTLRTVPTTRATALLWGVNVTNNNGGWLNIDELEFRATSGGATLCTGGAQLADKCTSASWLPSFAFNASTATSWQAGAGATTGKLWYCFNTAPNPSYAAMKGWTSGASTDMPKDFTFFYSLDGITETTVYTKTGETWTNGQVREYAL